MNGTGGHRAAYWPLKGHWQAIHQEPRNIPEVRTAAISSHFAALPPLPRVLRVPCLLAANHGTAMVCGPQIAAAADADGVKGCIPRHDDRSRFAGLRWRLGIGGLRDGPRTAEPARPRPVGGKEGRAKGRATRLHTGIHRIYCIYVGPTMPTPLLVSNRPKGLNIS